MNDTATLQSQLDRVLAFFPRVDARINGLFGVNTLVLAVGALNVAAPDLRQWYVTIPGVLALIALLLSYAFLFRANFPDVRGGAGSLVYFVEIQKRTESVYQSEVLGCSDDDYRKDLIGQIWRNSQILCDKYTYAKKAIICTSAALLPFALFLATTATLHVRIPIVKS
ncbi:MULTISPECIES: Pycsar system effector family protein [Sphingomonas]|uniref:DUF5706 domain-containing protein n=1 Tax=Sphingomonas insulae TaxID=424800 RepID=A0ABP3TAP6_9SPHN|nr:MULTISPECIES: Pycsar system effector family protein [Sphingomonas]NIJ30938.1 hypothetical protein [Sphingomonas insulae]TCP30401.1 hypothetical protein EV292_11374 [Sphingomonas sp. BK235]